MKTLMRTLTLSAAALAALVAAPKSNAQEFRRGEARPSRPFQGENFRGHEFRGGEFRGHEFRGGDFRGHGFRGGEFRGQGFRGGEFRGQGFRGGEFRGQGFRGGDFRGREFWGHEFRGRAFVRPPAYFYGRRYTAPFRVYAGSRFYSYCPGPGYVYVDDLGWVFPPFPDAEWIPAYVDEFGVQVDGCWR